MEDGRKKLEATGRLVVRPSGTEPLIRVMAEGEDNALTEAVAKKVAELLAKRLAQY